MNTLMKVKKAFAKSIRRRSARYAGAYRKVSLISLSKVNVRVGIVNIVNIYTKVIRNMNMCNLNVLGKYVYIVMIKRIIERTICQPQLFGNVMVKRVLNFAKIAIRN